MKIKGGIFRNEAVASGAEAIVTACPWCEKTFKDAIRASASGPKVDDTSKQSRRQSEKGGNGSWL